MITKKHIEESIVKIIEEVVIAVVKYFIFGGF